MSDPLPLLGILCSKTKQRFWELGRSPPFFWTEFLRQAGVNKSKISNILHQLFDENRWWSVMMVTVTQRSSFSSWQLTGTNSDRLANEINMVLVYICKTVQLPWLYLGKLVHLYMHLCSAYYAYSNFSTAPFSLTPWSEEQKMQKQAIPMMSPD